MNGKLFGQLFFVLQLVMLVINSFSSVISAWTQKQKTT
ncbi:putative membrane protein [Vibrio parahaemolyticus 605]|nr:putative membrane protein [Vibrio parahaemolyticus 605]